jgi:hypothetical protein
LRRRVFDEKPSERSRIVDVTRALADLAEVRSRLASVQRFRGLSGAAALASANYGAILVWQLRHWSARSRAELRTAGMTILPSIVAGGLFTTALLERGDVGLLPGVWCECYALGLLASRSMLPAGVVPAALMFAAAGGALLFAAGTNALSWWVMPATFGIGQVAIGMLIARDEAKRAREIAP